MAAKSNSTTTRRKSKLVSHPKVTYITPISIRREDFGRLWEFRETLTPFEISLINPLLRDLAYPHKVLKEMRKLLGKPIEQCKVIPFPARKNNHPQFR